MKHSHVEGIVLKTHPFKEYDKIITLFTPQEGLLNLFVKGSKRSSLQLLALTTPFTVAEYLYTQGKSTLGRFQEGTLINQHIKLRDSLPCFEAANFLIKAISASQWPGKASPQLYFLSRLFLEKLPEATFPFTLAASFLLKILKHEGVLQTQTLCCLCRSEIKEGFRSKGELFCPSDEPQGSLFFSAEEESLLFILAHSRSIATLSTFSIEDAFLQKIDFLFTQAVSH